MFVVMIVALVAVAFLQPIAQHGRSPDPRASRDHRPCARRRNPATLDAAGTRCRRDGLLAGQWIGAGDTVPDGTAVREEAAMAVFRFEPFGDPVERLLSMATTGTRTPLGMPMDIYRTKDGTYHVEADLPGVAPDTVEVTIEHGTLTIKADRAPGYGDSDQVIVAERSQGPFTRRLSLGEGVDSGHLTADYADGVLRVTIPAAPKAQAHRIEVTHAPASKRTDAGKAIKK
jgi:HSP20 family protein